MWIRISLMRIRIRILWIPIAWCGSGSGYGSGSDQIPNFENLFFPIEIIMLNKNDLLRFVLGNYLFVFTQKCNFNVKKYDIRVISVDSSASFSWFWLIFCYPDPDPGGQNDADPTGSRSTSLVLSLLWFRGVDRGGVTLTDAPPLFSRTEFLASCLNKWS